MFSFVSIFSAIPCRAGATDLSYAATTQQNPFLPPWAPPGGWGGFGSVNLVRVFAPISSPVNTLGGCDPFALIYRMSYEVLGSYQNRGDLVLTLDKELVNELHKAAGRVIKLLRKDLQPMYDDMGAVRGEVTDISERIAGIKKDLTAIETQMRSRRGKKK